MRLRHVNMYRALGCLLKAADYVQSGRLAASIRSKETQNLALSSNEIEIFDCNSIVNLASSKPFLAKSWAVNLGEANRFDANLRALGVGSKFDGPVFVFRSVHPPLYVGAKGWVCDDLQNQKQPHQYARETRSARFIWSAMSGT